MRTLRLLVTAVLLSLVARQSSAQLVPAEPTGGNIVAPASNTDASTSVSSATPLRLSGMWFGIQAARFLYSRGIGTPSATVPVIWPANRPRLLVRRAR